MGQNNIIKVHTPYMKDHQMKNMVNTLKQKKNASQFKITCVFKQKSSTKGGGQPLSMGEKGEGRRS
jgi:hypothetical protein